MTGIAFVVNTKMAVPRSVTNSSLYSIVTRRTMFGLHGEMESKDLDMMCTKTGLVVFLYEKDVADVARLIDVANKSATVLVRDLRCVGENRSVTYGNSPYISTLSGSTESLKPLSIESIPYGYLEKICMLHYFDMLVVYNQKIVEKKSGNYEIAMDCFHYRTTEPPNRSIQEMRFRDMLL